MTAHFVGCTDMAVETHLPVHILSFNHGVEYAAITGTGHNLKMYKIGELHRAECESDCE